MNGVSSSSSPARRTGLDACRRRAGPRHVAGRATCSRTARQRMRVPKPRRGCWLLPEWLAGRSGEDARRHRGHGHQSLDHGGCPVTSMLDRLPSKLDCPAARHGNLLHHVQHGSRLRCPTGLLQKRVAFRISPIDVTCRLGDEPSDESDRAAIKQRRTHIGNPVPDGENSDNVEVVEQEQCPLAELRHRPSPLWSPLFRPWHARSVMVRHRAGPGRSRQMEVLL